MKKIIFVSFLFTAQLCGAQWNPELRLTNDPSESFTSLRRSVASNRDTVHVVWADKRFGFLNAIFYKRSVDAGLTWDDEMQLTNGNSDATLQSIHVSGPLVHIAWCDDRDSSDNYSIFYKRSTDGGSTWGEDTRISLISGLSWNPSIALSGSFVYIVWYAECNDWWEVYYRLSTDGGETWADEKRLTFDPAGSYLASIAVSGPVLHVVWHDLRDGNREIYYKRSLDGGLNWEEDTRLSYSNFEARDPELDVSGSFVHLVWQDVRDGNPEIYYMSSPDQGLTWGEEERLTFDEATSERPSMIVDDSMIHVVWHDMRSGHNQIYYKCSADAGLSWNEDTLLSKTNYNSQFPSVDFSGNWLNVVWSDLRDGNWEIYFKNKFIESPPIGINDDFSKNPDLPVSIYPNPASRQLTVDSRQFAVSISQLAVWLSIVDLYGREIKEFANIYSFPYTIDISDLTDGLFILRIINEEGKSGSVKFLKITK